VGVSEGAQRGVSRNQKKRLPSHEGHARGEGQQTSDLARRAALLPLAPLFGERGAEGRVRGCGKCATHSNLGGFHRAERGGEGDRRAPRRFSEVVVHVTHVYRRGRRGSQRETTTLVPLRSSASSAVKRSYFEILRSHPPARLAQDDGGCHSFNRGATAVNQLRMTEKWDRCDLGCGSAALR
jgi:hypothetical protein